MSLLRRLRERMLPKVGEVVAVYQDGRLLAEGTVVAADKHTITIAGARGLVDLDTDTLRRGLGDGTISVKRNTRIDNIDWLDNDDIFIDIDDEVFFDD